MRRTGMAAGAVRTPAQTSVRVAAIAALLLAGAAARATDCDRSRGESLFAKCAACHLLDTSGQSLVGPNLHGILGRRIGSVSGFPYSSAMASTQGEWSVEALDGFIAAPMSYMPGTQMAFAGLRRAEDRRDLICYLRSGAANP